jgi:short-subunit dehydrogenase
MNAIGKGARLELKRDNINVLTVCPGYVNTDFGAHVVANRQGNIRPKSFRGVTAEQVAQATYRGYRKAKREVVVPWTMIAAIRLYQLFPGLVEWGMTKAMRNSGKSPQESKEK